MKRSGAADLPLHYGYVPQWLAERMARLGLAITEAVITDYGKEEILKRLADPFWFQSLGAVMGMDWHSANIKSFVEEPHTGICGENQGEILNLTDVNAINARTGITAISHNDPDKTIKEFNKLILPAHHEVRAENINLKRLGATLWLAHDQQPENFEELLLLKGVGARTLQSLALVSEVIHGSASRFKDPARFSFAHGGKDGHPFPVPIKVYDETIDILQTAVQKAKIGINDKNEAIKKLHQIASGAEEHFTPNKNFEKLIEKEREDAWKYGGRTVFGKSQKAGNPQLKLF